MATSHQSAPACAPQFHAASQNHCHLHTATTLLPIPMHLRVMPILSRHVLDMLHFVTLWMPSFYPILQLIWKCCVPLSSLTYAELHATSLHAVSGSHQNQAALRIMRSFVSLIIPALYSTLGENATKGRSNL